MGLFDFFKKKAKKKTETKEINITEIAAVFHFLIKEQNLSREQIQDKFKSTNLTPSQIDEAYDLAIEGNKVMDQLKENEATGQERKIENSSVPKESMTKLFGTENTYEKFELEFDEALKKYFSSFGIEHNFEFFDQNNQPVPFKVGVQVAFDKWKTIRSKPDRRGILFQYFDHMELEKKQNAGQVIQRYVQDRYALKALQIIQPEKIEEMRNELAVEDFWSIAKMYRILGLKIKARKFIDYGIEKFPDEQIIKVELANILHLSGNHEEQEKAHQIINDILKSKIDATEEKEIPIFKYFLFSEGYIDSSIFAIIFLKQLSAPGETWQALSDEYSYCPIFRQEYINFLKDNNESILAAVKLSNAPEDFPFNKTLVKGAIAHFQKMKKENKISQMMEENLQKYLKYDEGINLVDE